MERIRNRIADAIRGVCKNILFASMLPVVEEQQSKHVKRGHCLEVHP